MSDCPIWVPLLDLDLFYSPGYSRVSLPSETLSIRVISASVTYRCKPQ